MRTLAQINAERDTTRARLHDLTAEGEALADRAGREGRQMSSGELERVGRLAPAIERSRTALTSLDAEAHDAIVALVRTGVGGVAEGSYQPPRDDQPAGADPRYAGFQASALRTIERYSGGLSAAANDRLEAIVRRPDPFQFENRYLAAVGEPAYHSAFGKMLRDPQHGHLGWTPAERDAFQSVTEIHDLRAAMSEGTGSAGGFAIPYTLDPSIVISSSGVLNPIRSVARVFTIATRDWKGVSSDGVVAAYVAEAAVATDASPVLAQPVIQTAQGRAFIPASIEVLQDWGGAQNELLTLISDGRDILDATAFLTGNGTASPVGLLAIGTTGSLATAQRIQTTTTAVYAVGDPWLLKAALPARFIPNTTIAANPAVFDTTYRFVGGNSTEPVQFDAGRGGSFLGRPKIEWSTMVTTTTTASRIMVAGDFRQFFIADRLGMTAELIPHLTQQAVAGAGVGMPTGQRGLYAYWRTGSVVAVPNAFRYLEVK